LRWRWTPTKLAVRRRITFLEGLNEIGLDYLFCNFGTDHAPLIEAMAGFKRDGRKMPGPSSVRTRSRRCTWRPATPSPPAAARASSSTSMPARPIRRWRCTTFAADALPVLLMAGRAPYTTRGELLGTRDTYVHFVQEPFDQAGLVRPYTKWEYNLPSGVVTKEALRRAHTVMMSDPRGPVYLTFPPRDAGRAVVGGTDPLLSGGALRAGLGRRRRCRVRRCDRDQAACPPSGRC
jgi:acetolactate synthase-1/2/3 large subunit